ncbi:hypothetical protein EJ08DRAFT_660222 [Tothia fuscella]|uniref:Heterokaryon incompatibility domain-containing protein n=1 Tax=Tothia fuscella TaxID=1048955 RepID=A0A9P4NRZ9_9PEZI|nr:hypothetical protein EJ08DRAFT_660222 [Tothia fuscella]
MGQIYSRAEKVIAWLGPAVEDSNFAVDWTMQFGTRSYELGIGTTPELRLRNLRSQSQKGEVLPNDKLQNFLRDLHEQLFTADSTTSLKLYDALSKICKRPYWSRVWVV